MVSEDIEEGIDIRKLDYLLPPMIIDRLSSLGIIRLRQFQVKALEVGLQGKNLLVIAPTGSGKTLVGELLATTNFIQRKKKSLFLVPYKALAEELKNTLEQRYPFVRLGISTGDYREISIKRLGHEYDLMIVTYEKADMIRREKPSWLSNVGLIVIDEIHLIGESDRGALLDAVVTKFRELNIQIIALSATISNPEELAEWLGAEIIQSNYRPVKLLEGVYLPKATKIYYYDPKPEEAEEILIKTPNENSERTPSQTSIYSFFSEEKLKDMLKSVLGPSIEIEEVREGFGKIIKRELSHDNLSETLMNIFYDRLGHGKIGFYSIRKAPLSGKGFSKYILDLTYDLLSSAKKYGISWQILIFRRSRKLSQTTAEKIANMLEKTGLTKLFPDAPKIARELLNTVDEITPLTENLANVLKRGVAFHHAGLTREERAIVEKAFRDRKIGVIVATPTLGAGINLPARRVVIEHIMYDPILGRNVLISVAHYKQRAGRAGRPGLDTVGESVLIASKEQELIEFFDHYIFGQPEPISSFLGAHLPILRSQVLAYIVSEADIKPSLKDVLSFFKRTFYYWQALRRNDLYALVSLEDNLIRCLQELISWGYLEVFKEGRKLQPNEATKKLKNDTELYFQPTLIGRKISQLYLDPVSAREIIEVLLHWKEMGKERISELLLAISRTPDLAPMRAKLLSNIKTLAKFILETLSSFKNDNILPPLIPKKILNVLEKLSKRQYIELSPAEEELLSAIGITSLLFLWINEVPVKDILTPFSPNFSGGDFRELIRISEWLLYCAKELASILRLPPPVIKRIDILRSRIEYGVTEDLLELVKIPEIGRVRARRLKQYGFDSLEKLAKASVARLSLIPGIGEKLAKKIIEYANVSLRKKSNLLP